MTVDILSELVEKKTSHEVVWKAYDGQHAVDLCGKNTPDIILMDLIMPIMDGAQATRQIMQESPCAILIVTSSVKRNLDKVFEAMGYGALDVVKTPSLGIGGEKDTTDELIHKMENIGKIISNEKNDRQRHIDNIEKLLKLKQFKNNFLPPLLAIGASTGGPRAVAKLLSEFPSPPPFATVIIQHIDEEFTEGLAKWLSEQALLNVRVAHEGDRLEQGSVYLAGKDQHLIVDENGVLGYSTQPEEIAYKPSIDVFFNHIRRLKTNKFVAILLTGMGGDGAVGLKLLKEAGWHTIAQNKESCIVYGMPKVAADLDAAVEILSLEEISARVIERSKIHISRCKTGACIDE